MPCLPRASALHPAAGGAAPRCCSATASRVLRVADATAATQGRADAAEVPQAVTPLRRNVLADGQAASTPDAGAATVRRHCCPRWPEERVPVVLPVRSRAAS